MSDFAYEEHFNSIGSKYPTMGVVNKFITTMREESKEKKILTYYAKTYNDVLRFYDEIHDCDRNLVFIS